MIWRIRDLLEHGADIQCQRNVGDPWLPSRPTEGPWIHRLKGAWLVLTGKADVVVWDC